MGTLVNGLGGEVGFGENSVTRNDDGYKTNIDISSIFPGGINFFGQTYTEVAVNTNGNITFNGGLSTFTPTSIGGTYTSPIVAPFWADVDTRNTADVPASPGGNSMGSDLVWYDIDTTTNALTVTWDDVGYFSYHNDKTNAFQLQLINLGNNSFEMKFIYEDVNWTTGDASSGSGGLGGVIARAGYSGGDGIHYYEIPFSGYQDQMLLLEDYRVAGQAEAGVWSFIVNGGEVVGVGLENTDDTLDGTEFNDILDGRSGDDILEGGLGDDTLTGGLGEDSLFGGDGNDLIYADFGSDAINGGADQDTVVYNNLFESYNLIISGLNEYTVDELSDPSLGHDSLIGVEQISFADGVMTLDVFRDNQETFARVYSALLGRLPDEPGLQYWVNDIAGGNTLQNAAQAFTEQPEYISRFGGAQNDEEFINALYNEILGRDADQAGFDYWMDEIQQTGNYGGMIISFANGHEYIDLTNNDIDGMLLGLSLQGYDLAGSFSPFA